MSNDDRLVPRGSAIPVSVRRPLVGESIDPALAAPQSAGPTGPPAAPNPHIIYINNAPAPAVIPLAPAAPLPPAPTQTIHHHHYNTTNYTQPAAPPRISIRIPGRSAHSALGMASMALGVVACLVCWVPWLGLVAVPVGAIGTLLGVLGILISLLFRKSSASLPFAGVFVCCLAAGISIASTRTLPYWKRQLQNGLSTVLPQSIAPPRAPVTAVPPLAPPPLPIHADNIFDSFHNVPAPAAAQPQVQPPAPHAASGAKPPAVSSVNPNIAAARDQLIAAQKACDARTMQTADYQAAVKAAADARAHEAQLRETSPGSSDLMQASQEMIKADNAVTDLLSQTQSSDAGVIAAREALEAARGGVGR